MLYASIDIETSGLDSERNQILSFGAIIEDTKKKLPFNEIPKFYAVIPHREISGSPYAITLNSKIIELISIYNNGNKEVIRNIELMKKIKFIEESDLAKSFYDFLFLNGITCGEFNTAVPVRKINDILIPEFNSSTKPIRFTVAGKNYGTFDKLFVEKLPWWKKLFTVSHKILDPGITCVDWENDDEIPGLDLCKERCGIEGVVTHNALDDAWDVIQILRKSY